MALRLGWSYTFSNNCMHDYSPFYEKKTDNEKKTKPLSESYSI